MHQSEYKFFNAKLESHESTWVSGNTSEDCETLWEKSVSVSVLCEKFLCESILK
ncbi:hypothetical protein Q9233_013334 [Columba guinea]|nr:hypothetical protein Q9233_013334 [Columba guinea]